MVHPLPAPLRITKAGEKAAEKRKSVPGCKQGERAMHPGAGEPGFKSRESPYINGSGACLNIHLLPAQTQRERSTYWLLRRNLVWSHGSVGRTHCGFYIHYRPPQKYAVSLIFLRKNRSSARRDVQKPGCSPSCITKCLLLEIHASVWLKDRESAGLRPRTGSRR